MSVASQYALSALAGAAVGYFCCVFAANLEDWQFYSIRSFVTGRTAMSEIVAHPADGWVFDVIWTLFVAGGATVGVLVAQQFQSGRRGDQ